MEGGGDNTRRIRPCLEEHGPKGNVRLPILETLICWTRLILGHPGPKKEKKQWW